MCGQRPIKAINNGLTRRCTRPPTALRSCLATGFQRRVSLSLGRSARLGRVRKSKAAFGLSAKLCVSSFRKIAHFQPRARVHSVLCKYLQHVILTLRQLGVSRSAFAFALFRQVSLWFAARAFSRFRSLVSFCKYLQAVFSAFGAAKFVRCAFGSFRSSHVFVFSVPQSSRGLGCCKYLQELQFQQQVSAAFQLRPNKALHPTAYSSIRFVRSSLHSFRFRRRVSLSLWRSAQRRWSHLVLPESNLSAIH